MSTLYSLACTLALVASFVAVFRPGLGGPAFPAAAAVGWVGVMSLIITDPPLGLAQGEPVQIMMILASVLLGIAFGLTALQTPTKYSRKLNDNFTVTNEGFRLPKLFGGKDPEDEERERSRGGKTDRQIRNEAYRARTRRAYEQRRR